MIIFVATTTSTVTRLPLFGLNDSEKNTLRNLVIKNK